METVERVWWDPNREYDYATELLGDPYFEFGLWWQRVRYSNEGGSDETVICEKSKECIDQIRVGFKFLA